MTAPTFGREQAASFDARRRKFALLVVGLAFTLDILDSTVVNLAAPSIRAGLHAPDEVLQWLVAGYGLSFSMLLILGGRLGDICGYRTMFAIGLAAFALTSALCGLAVDGSMLICSRILQGAAAAMMAPQVISLVQLLYAPAERGPVMGLFGALGGMTAALGPVVGGLLIHADLLGLGWRLIFLVNLPLTALALAGAYAVLPAGRSAHALRPDIIGSALVGTATFSLVLPLIEWRDPAAPAWLPLLALACPLLLALLAWHTRRLGDVALIPPCVLRDPVFRRGLMVILALQTALNGYFLIFALTLQMGMKLGVLAASLTTLPFAVGAGVGVGVISRRLGVRLGRRLSTFGMAVLLAGWALLAVLVATNSPVAPPMILSVPALLIAGLGMGMMNGPLSSLVLSGVDLRHVGAASGLLSSCQQLGAAVGSAGIGALYFGIATRMHRADGFVEAFLPALAGAGLLVAAAAVGVQVLPRAIERRR